MKIPESRKNRKRRRKAEKMYGRYRRSFRGVPEIEATQAVLLLGRNRIVFVDVRDPVEQVVSMLPGALTEEEFLQTSRGFGEKIILCYCTIGYRSGLFVKKYGPKYSDMYNLSGGLLLWLHAGGIVENNGTETHQVHVYGRKWALQPDGYDAVF